MFPEQRALRMKCTEEVSMRPLQEFVGLEVAIDPGCLGKKARRMRPAKEPQAQS